MLQQANAWLYTPKPNPGARVRLVCFPHAGSGAFGFHSWPTHLPAWVEVCAVQLPGRETRLPERPIASLERLIEQLIEALGPHLDRPFALFGHSMGALVAFELARALRRAGERAPAHLIVSGRVAPDQPPRQRPMYAEPDEVFIERLRQFKGTADAILNTPKLMRLLFPVLKADFQLNEAYTFKREAPLSCPISVFGGADDRVAPVELMAGWREQTGDRFTQRVVPGGHFYVQSAVERLCRHVTEDLLGGATEHARDTSHHLPLMRRG